MLSTLEAVLLGILQGLTEFLPVSSSGHLALAEGLFGLQEGGLALNVLLHGGTLVATVLVLRRPTSKLLTGGVQVLAHPSRLNTVPGGRDALLVCVAMLPTGVLGLSLKGLVERWTHSPVVLALGFMLTTLLLLSTRYAKPGACESPSVAAALLLGVAQGVAVLPGLSRSGATIAVALWLGLQRQRAFELSMLMSLPAVFGALLITVPGATLPGAMVPAVVGAAVAFITGALALFALRFVVIRGHFAWFALWVLPMAAVAAFVGR